MQHAVAVTLRGGGLPSARTSALPLISASQRSGWTEYVSRTTSSLEPENYSLSGYNLHMAN
jgi:hypothetical protein